MKKLPYYLIFSLLSSLTLAEEVVFFEEPPTAKEILESFGEPVVKTRGDKKSRKLVFNNSVTALAAAPTAETAAPQNPALTNAAPPKKQHKKPVAFPLTFPSGSAVLSKEAQKYVDSMAAALTQQPNLVLHISGHTDMAGGDDINKPLSLKRAESVRDYLKDHNISETRLEISGEGSLFPLDLKDPYAAANRRVQFDKITKEN